MKLKPAFLFLILAMAAGLPACEDDFVQLVVPPPLFVRFTTPADSAELDVGDPVHLSITFNRTLTLREISIQLFPPPISAGALTLTGSGRNVTWFDVVTDPEWRVQTLLLDGPHMEIPYSMSWYTGAPVPNASFSGNVVSEDTTRVKPLGAVVFALDWESPFNPLEPGSFNEILADQTAVRSVAVVENLDVRDEGVYAIGNRPTGSRYLVVGVIDTSGDGRYDPFVDWWGYHGEGPANDPTVISAELHPENINAQVDIMLRPPR